MLTDQRVRLIFLTLLVGSHLSGKHLSENRTDIDRRKAHRRRCSPCEKCEACMVETLCSNTYLYLCNY
jgi:hypothetical protein